MKKKVFLSFSFLVFLGFWLNVAMAKEPEDLSEKSEVLKEKEMEKTKKADTPAKEIVFGKIRDINEKEKSKLNLIEEEIIEESDYEKIKDYNTQILYLEIVEVNESNIKKQIPVRYKKVGKIISVDKNRSRLIIHRELALADKKGKIIKLFNKGKSKTLLTKYITKYNDGRFPCDSEIINIFETLPDKIVSYKEYIPPSRYFTYADIDNCRSFKNLEINLKSLSSAGEITIDIKSDGIKNSNIKIAINQTKMIEFSERKIDLTKYGDLKKIEDKSGYKLPEEMIAKTTIYITNYGFNSIYGGSPNE